MAEAEAEVSAAQNAVNQLRDDVAINQQQAKEFATHLNEWETLREDLNHVEAMHRAGLDRLTKLQASELERAPRIEVVEAATPSREPWRPNYRLNSLIAGAGSLVFGLFAIWFTELIAGPGFQGNVGTTHLGGASARRREGITVDYRYLHLPPTRANCPRRVAAAGAERRRDRITRQHRYR